MKWNCYHCNRDLFAKDCGYVSITNTTKENLMTGRLYFHGHCFQEIAGEEYTDALADTSRVFGLTIEEQTLIHQGQHIPAIKAIRTRTDLGLKDAKDLADMYRNSLPKKFEPTR